MRFFIGAKMAIYDRDELEEKIRALDEKIENAQSQVSFNGRSVSYQVSEWTKQRDRYQQMLNELLAETRQRVKTPQNQICEILNNGNIR